MAQLIKLQDYITRYETDLSRYPNQFVRLKKQQWKKLHRSWLEKDETPFIDKENVSGKEKIVEKITHWFKRDQEVVIDIPIHQQDQALGPDEEMHLSSKFMNARTEDDLKKVFLNEMYSFQLKWASSTMTERSHLERRYRMDQRLKHFLQSFPDSYFVFYEPIVLMKKAPVELEVIIVTPTETWCLAFLEEENKAIFTGKNDRFWKKIIKGKESKVLNPLLSLQRMTNIVQQIYIAHDVEQPIRKAVISRNGYLDYADISYDIQLFDLRNYEEWNNQMRSNTSPLKMMQLRATQALLDYCDTVSLPRIDWGKSTNEE